MTICIIGIDCATQANKVGLARGFVKKNSLIIDKVLKPRSKESVSDIVTNWIIPEIKTLLAIDALR
jgi:hypothetical protein